MDQHIRMNRFQGTEVKATVEGLQMLQQLCEDEAAKSEVPERKSFYEGMALAYSTIEQKVKGHAEYIQPEFIERLFDAMNKVENTPSAKHDYTETCSFCEKSRNEVDALALGPGVSICIECLDFGKEVIESQPQQAVENTPTANTSYTETCSFCQKSISEVGVLAVGPGVSICAGCLEFGKNVI
ncbi:ClpX C4-type zinc finger protein [Domibacillus sp. DTU_2020_1001157_1_SI_ALB_TIR_016]|uniref:ClpX C4-type zinc finger protein n=1 Tax=Domibacillus sp. DTU_2020_1001157_1_SI_ALB_TIR_016 TaxID=3077789 RepID=UPI0028E3C465|nr:ClpX C4-type zinc finger protein [Domibacillus sp. DTU_2020_1001157_1_SI_ALB_TIR_016]WNS78895.1 ClpX C4-type zinc finger protein [Domibacillus sp. DTU_2020_1001157_1_SI_ALB_TIR_016]